MRPHVDETWMALAKILSLRSTCARSLVGCVFLNKRGHVISTGYNGVHAGAKHCIEHPCPGANAVHGTDLDKCVAIHAEQNALLQCPDVYQIHKIYTTHSPCMHCMKLLLNTSCQLIIYDQIYSQKALQLWNDANRDANRCVKQHD